MSAFGQVPRVAAWLQVEAHCGSARQSSFGRIGEDWRGVRVHSVFCCCCWVVAQLSGSGLEIRTETFEPLPENAPNTEHKTIALGPVRPEVEAVPGSRQIEFSRP